MLTITKNSRGRTPNPGFEGGEKCSERKGGEGGDGMEWESARTNNNYTWQIGYCY